MAVMCRLFGHKTTRKVPKPGAWVPFGGGYVTEYLTRCPRCGTGFRLHG